MSSIPYDWAIRRWVEMNFTFEVLYPSRIPYLAIDTPIGRRLVELSGKLAAVDARFDKWASDLGVPVASLKASDERERAICEIDALVSLAYGLDKSQVMHVFASFHRGWDYEPRLEMVLEYYEEWKDK
jgi:hypothetical protein